MINPETGEVIEVKSIEQCLFPPMRNWYRIYEKEDSGTIAYAPDLMTAKIVSVAPIMFAFFQMQNSENCDINQKLFSQFCSLVNSVFDEHGE